MKKLQIILVIGLALGTLAQAQQSLTVYTGRSQGLVEEVVKEFQKESGIKINVRYGSDAEILAALQEEGNRSPADVFWANTSGALEVAAQRKLLSKLPGDLLGKPTNYVPSLGNWVPVSARFRVLAYNPSKIKASELPASVMDFPKIAKLKGRIGWTPTYSSFQDFVTAMRVMKGEAATKAWLLAMKAAGAKDYANNPAMLDALRAGEIDAALTNHYYIQRVLFGSQEGEYEGKDEDKAKEQAKEKAAEAKAGLATFYFAQGDVGSLALVTGAGILATSKNPNAQKFLNYLLSSKAQQLSTDQIREYPVVQNIKIPKGMISFSDAAGRSPKLDFSKLTDLEGTLKLMREVGIL